MKRTQGYGYTLFVIVLLAFTLLWAGFFVRCSAPSDAVVEPARATVEASATTVLIVVGTPAP